MSIHPLRMAYINAIHKQYHQLPRGDRNPAMTEAAAMKIAKLGLNYTAYMDVALRLCDGLAKHNGWLYPYYNVVIGDKTINRIAKMTAYTEDLDDDEDCSGLFECELSYAMAYIDWWFCRGTKPIKNDDVPVMIKSKVAEYICRLYGIPYTSSNYNVICKALENRDDEQ